jgi:hypothetical protein
LRSINSLFTTAVVALAFASTAGAQEAPAYLGEAGESQQGVAGTGGTLGQLPFTGLELTLFAGIGFALLIMGLGLRRAAGNRS